MRLNQEETVLYVNKSKKGDKEAFYRLYQDNVNSIYFLCLKYLKNEEDALDVTQDTFLTALEKINTINRPETFNVWLNRIAVNKCINILKDNNRIIYEEFNEENVNIEELNSAFIPEEYVNNEEKRKVILDIMETKLSDVQRMTVFLYYYEGETVSDIALILNCSEGTVKSRLNSARNIIKKSIEEKENKGFPILSISPFLALSSLVGIESAKLTIPQNINMVVSAKFDSVFAVGSTTKISGGKIGMTGKKIALITAGSVVALAATGAVVAMLVLGGGKSSKVEDDVSNNINNSNTVETTKETGERKWKHFNGDKLDITQFDKNKWDATIYIDNKPYEYPMSLDDVIEFVDDDAIKHFEIWEYIDADGEEQYNSKALTVDDIVSPDPNSNRPVQNIYFLGEGNEELHYSWFDFGAQLPEHGRLGDSAVKHIEFGYDNLYQTQENDVFDRLKLTPNGKKLSEMTYLDIIEEIGQPSIYYDNFHYLIYEYDNVVVRFEFSKENFYDEPVEEYVCIKVVFSYSDTFTHTEYYDNLEPDDFQYDFRPNFCHLVEE